MEHGQPDNADHNADHNDTESNATATPGSDQQHQQQQQHDNSFGIEDIDDNQSLEIYENDSTTTSSSTPHEQQLLHQSRSSTPDTPKRDNTTGLTYEAASTQCCTNHDDHDNDNGDDNGDDSDSDGDGDDRGSKRTTLFAAGAAVMLAIGMGGIAAVKAAAEDDTTDHDDRGALINDPKHASTAPSDQGGAGTQVHGEPTSSSMQSGSAAPDFSQSAQLATSAPPPPPMPAMSPAELQVMQQMACQAASNAAGTAASTASAAAGAAAGSAAAAATYVMINLPLLFLLYRYFEILSF